MLTTHYMDEAEHLCDRVAIMDHGKVLQLDTPEALRAALDARSGVGAAPASLDDVFLDLTGREYRA